ncbi:MAG: DUF839 domain-containing protein [Halobacteriales archaeon]|nr:DUF839 domain-containing protein [Halobacteriales archaeon]
MVDLTRRNLMATSVAATLGASVADVASAEDSDTKSAPMVKGELKRFASTAFGAEVTGPFVTGDGSLFFSLQHPSRENAPPYDKAGIGYVEDYKFSFNGENNFTELAPPQTEEEKERVRVGDGQFTLLAQEEEQINRGSERLGIPETTDGRFIDSFAGSRYADLGFTPDCNEFIPTNEAGTEGFLFTNFEHSPGNVVRMPLSQNDDGTWEADLGNAVNLANTDELRELGGTRINCYGDRSPWNTMLSAEEDYSHPRVSLTATVSDMVEENGIGRRGGAAFWNRPNPSEIQGKVGEYYENGWYVQGYFALAGVELLAYYLGADPVDQTDDGGNDLTPIGESYPNRYRYGYIVDFRNPSAETPEPVKYYCMGRAAWEAPDVQSNERTVYLCSDGANKGLYKFEADAPIPNYTTPMDVKGTLYAPQVTNAEAARKNPPGEVNLELEWIELGHASNREVESWIEEYDDITQIDYLETHADWSHGDDVTPEILEQADREVVKNGNQDYITDEEILDWAEQYEQDGPDGVDEGLRRVPFLETRAAAKEVGATIEFRKAEGIDSKEGAGPGDYIYIGLSEVNDGLADDEGDIQFKRVDGGMVYRARLETDYNISTLEPVIVGPDASDPASISDDALVNIDNVYALDDGRVLCCEDADQLGRSYKNDCLYVYDPD